jgi:sec-independent protein translocase protein TatB
MFEIGWSELLVVGIVALIAIGPKELPGVLRTVGQYMGKVRRMAAEFQGQFQEAMREAEMADLKKQVDEMTDAAKGLTDFDPLESVKKDIEGVTSGVSGTDSAAATDTASAPAVESEPHGDAPALPAAEMPVSLDPAVAQPEPSHAAAATEDSQPQDSQPQDSQPQEQRKDATAPQVKPESAA